MIGVKGMDKVMVKCFLILAIAIFAAACGSDSSKDTCSNIGLPSKIVNGTRCGDEERSPVVLLTLFKDGKRRGNCSGTVIGAQAVLTAAHCVYEMEMIRVTVGGQEIEASQFHKHPQADVDSQSIKNVANDLAVITLPQAANVRPLPILVSRQLVANEQFSIYGYGVSNRSGDEKKLRSGNMKADRVRDGYIESEYTSKSSSVCFGDSGGPATLTENDDPETTAIVGVASGISQGLPLPLPLPGLSVQNRNFPVPLPLPFSGNSCQEGDRAYHANVQTDAAMNFIAAHVPDLQLR